MTANNFVDQERARAVAWKATTTDLPDEARSSGSFAARTGKIGPFPFCLPPEHSHLNLLPDIRAGALALYAELGIPWHGSLRGGPSNHLLDSQVQCTNALAAMISDPSRILMAFGHVLDIAEVVPIEPDRFLTFEFIGPTDYFDEGNGGPRIRGTRCTSVDAAFMFRDSTGRRELALVEWKFTESYTRTRGPEPRRDATRERRYGRSFHDPAGPLHSDLLDLQAMFDEPFYQLMRQQLLAHHLELDPAMDVDIVRVLHVLNPRNLAYQSSLVRPEHRALGDSVDEVWSKLLRRPDRFIHVDPKTFLRLEVTSPGYVERYEAAGGAPQALTTRADSV